jgi:hypothetical protein
MEKQYTLVEKIEHIQHIVKKYRQILVDRKSNVIDKFSSFDYWYFFPVINIFAPNLFLAYQEMASQPYPDHHPKGYGMDGTRAKKRLKNYFDEVTGDEKKELKEKLKVFVNNYNQKIKGLTKMGEEVHILKPKPQFIEFFFDDGIISNEIHNSYKPISEASLVSSYEIAQRCEELIIDINKIRIIFNEKNTGKLWIHIRKPVESEDTFFRSINKLYILVKENTRDKNPNFKPDKKNGPYYYDRFPDNAEKIKHFKEDIEYIRHYETHKEDEESNFKYTEICKKYTSIKRKPIKIEEFQEFQINILSKFKVSLEELLNILFNLDKNI